MTYLNPGLGEDGAGGEDEEAVEQRVEGIKDCDAHNCNGHSTFTNVRVVYANE